MLLINPTIHTDPRPDYDFISLLVTSIINREYNFLPLQHGFICNVSMYENISEHFNNSYSSCLFVYVGWLAFVFLVSGDGH